MQASKASFVAVGIAQPGERGDFLEQRTCFFNYNTPDTLRRCTVRHKYNDRQTKGVRKLTTEVRTFLRRPGGSRAKSTGHNLNASPEHRNHV